MKNIFYRSYVIPNIEITKITILQRFEIVKGTE